MKTKKYFFAVASLLLLIQCTEVFDWNEETDTIPPSSISNPNVENIAGGAIITYTLPTDKDLLGVKAVYTYTENEEPREAFSSAFKDTIRLEGFMDTKARKVNLVSVDKSKNESQPVEVMIQPLTPPLEVIRNSLKINETFGGVFVSWENPDRENIGITLLAEDSTGFMELDYTYFTTERLGSYSFRGYESQPTKFRVQVSDKWNNISLPLDTTLLPIYEEYVVLKDQSNNVLWQRYGYLNRTCYDRGDYPSQYNLNGFERMFDGITNSNGYFNVGLDPSYKPSEFTGNLEDDEWENKSRTMYLTIDMVKEVKLSRFKLYGRAPSMNPRDMIECRIWATNEKPKGPEDFDNDRIKSLQYWTDWLQIEATDAWKNDWVNLGHFNVIPPSGALEQFQWTPEDLQWWFSGVDFDFAPEHSNTPFKYMRIESIRNIQGGNSSASNGRHIIEMEVYGSFAEE